MRKTHAARILRALPLSGDDFLFSDGWTSLLEARSGHQRPYSGDERDRDRRQGYLTDIYDDEENQVHGGWTGLSQASQDFSRYFNEDDSYHLRRYNRSRKVRLWLLIHFSRRLWGGLWTGINWQEDQEAQDINKETEEDHKTTQTSRGWLWFGAERQSFI